VRRGSQAPAHPPSPAQGVLGGSGNTQLTKRASQVVWVGLPMSGEVLARTRRAIHDEGVRRYGEPAPGPLPDSELWPGGRALLAGRETSDGQRELVMTAFGPDYGACSAAHRAATGHPAGAHVADLIGGDAR